MSEVPQALCKGETVCLLNRGKFCLGVLEDSQELKLFKAWLLGKLLKMKRVFPFDKWVDPPFLIYSCNLPWISCQGQLSDLRTQRDSSSLSQTGTWVSLETVTSAKLSRFLTTDFSSLPSPWCEQSMQCFWRLFNHEITVFLLCGYFMGLSGHKVDTLG